MVGKPFLKLLIVLWAVILAVLTIGLHFQTGIFQAQQRTLRGMLLQRNLKDALLVGLSRIIDSGAGQTRIICEDGYEFILTEREIVTANSRVENGDLILINTRELLLSFYRNGKVYRKYPVAVGDPDTPTPIGEWRIAHKGGNWGNGFGVRWLGLNIPWGVYGIHGTNKPWSIGTRASHGCIRMFNSHVVELYDLVKLGTPVHIVGILPPVVPRPDIGRGNTGRDVVYMQFSLRKVGFNPGVADGRFGERMEQAVQNMQLFYGLTPTGRICSNEQYLLKLKQPGETTGKDR